MRVGDLVKMSQPNQSMGVGVIIDFNIVYDRYGDPREKFAVVNWGSKFPFEEEYIDQLEVVNESR